MASWPWIAAGVAVAGAAGIVTAALVTERRRGGGRDLGAVRVALDRERLAEMRERPGFYRASADRIAKAACRVAKRGDAWGARKVYLADVAREIDVPMARLAPILASFHNLGWLELVRADLPAAMDARRLAASELEVGTATYHFLQVDPATC